MNIQVIDKSETVTPYQICWGKNLKTGRWICDIQFDEPESEYFDDNE